MIMPRVYQHRKLHIFPVDLNSESVSSMNGINIKNTQSEFSLDLPALLTVLDSVRGVLGYSDHRVDVWICSDAVMSKYNTLWRGNSTHTPPEQQLDLSPEEEKEAPQSPRQRGRSLRASVTLTRRRRVGATVAPALNSTDILSFPALDFHTPGVPIIKAVGVTGTGTGTGTGTNRERHLGDLIVSPAYIHRQCMRDRQMDEEGYEYDFEEGEGGVFRAMAGRFTVAERLPLLLVHGCIHLLGYDHETDADWKAMTAKEDRVMEQVGLQRPIQGLYATESQ